MQTLYTNGNDGLHHTVTKNYFQFKRGVAPLSIFISAMGEMTTCNVRGVACTHPESSRGPVVLLSSAEYFSIFKLIFFFFSCIHTFIVVVLQFKQPNEYAPINPLYTTCLAPNGKLTQATKYLVNIVEVLAA